MIDKSVKTRVIRALRSGRRYRRPMILLLTPLILVAGYELGGNSGMMVAAFGFPVILAIAVPNSARTAPIEIDTQTQLPLRAELVTDLTHSLNDGYRSEQPTCVLVVTLDKFSYIEERFNHGHVSEILSETALRIGDILRENDLLTRLDGPSFGIALSHGRVDLDVTMKLAGRIQRAVSQRINLDGSAIFLTASVGICLSSRLEAPTGDRLVSSANTAAIEAIRHGPSAIRSYSPAMRDRVERRNSLTDEVDHAMEQGDIIAFFQPQVEVSSGKISGFETLARWYHPDRGLISPGEFLPAIEQAGMMDRLSELMLREGLKALRFWDNAGFQIPQVGINFSSAELGDPLIVERICDELNEYGIGPERIVVEVLENVVADRADDIIVRNLSGLAKLGCCIDLDDFGTGHASITSIRRFEIERIKIDGTFVTGIDTDPEQQKMVGAILTMADKLGVNTLAEGVESHEEIAMLRRLGCGHLQGYALARPMPIADTTDWISDHLRNNNTGQLHHLKTG